MGSIGFLVQDVQRWGWGVPGVGLLVRQSASIQFAYTLGSLLRCGVPILTSLEQIQHPRLPIPALRERLCEGESFSTILASQTTAWSPLLVTLTGVAEQTGSLSALLLKAASALEEDLRHHVSRLSQLLEPALILGLGLLIGAVVISLYLPMFGLFEGMGQLGE